jgi:hypothetical protein
MKLRAVIREIRNVNFFVLNHGCKQPLGDVGIDERIILKCKAKVKQSRYRPGVAQKVPGIKLSTFHDNGTGWW